MGHFTGINFSTDNNPQSSDSRFGEGVGGADALISHDPNADMCHLQGSLKEVWFETSVAMLLTFSSSLSFEH